MADAHERHEPHETLFFRLQKIAENLSEENYKKAAIDQVLLMARSYNILGLCSVQSSPARLFMDVKRQ